MKYQNIEITNKFIHLTAKNIDFSSKGIYFIKGENGTGKSTFMNQLLFGQHKPIFESKKEETLYNKGRFNIISYVSQDDVETSDTVIEFVKKSNEIVDIENIKYLVKLFELENLDLNEEYSKLSGGEKKKLHIISALAKNTPYIFMDEPTNSLDEMGVKTFIEVLKMFSKTTTIVIVSHDPRLESLTANELFIEKGQILQERSNIEKNSKIVDVELPKAVNYTGMIRKGMKFSGNKIWMTLLFFTIGMIVLFNHYMYYNSYAMNELPPKNEILVQSVDRTYSDMNEIYRSGEGLKLNEENYLKLVYYDDIPAIYRKIGVETIYLTDMAYYDIYFTDYYKKDLEDDFFVLSIPSTIYSSDQQLSFLSDRMFTYLAEGRLPEDSKKEVALSENIIEKFYPEISGASVIGQTVKIEEENYEIVGVLLTDIALLSYETGVNKGIYSYSENNYEQFKNEQVTFLTDEQSSLNVYSFLVVTHDGFERQILNELLYDFSANNFSSQHFTMVFNQIYNKNFTLIMLVVNVVVAFSFGMIYFFATKSKTHTEVGRIIDYQNYYLNKKTVRNTYLLNVSIQYAIVLIFGVVISFGVGLITNLTSTIMSNLIIAFIMMILPIGLITLIEMRKVNA